MPNKTELLIIYSLCCRTRDCPACWRSDCPAGNYTVRFGALDGSGRKTAIDEVIKLQEFLQNSMYISYQSNFICGKVTPVYGE